MIAEAWLSIIACMAVLILTVLLVRRAPVTLALPLSYIINLLLIHLPGAYAYAISGGQYSGMRHSTGAISTGIMLTAVAAICFLIGCSISILNVRNTGFTKSWFYSGLDSSFVSFCLVSGWFLSFGVGVLRAVPTLGAAIYFGSAIWMLAAMTSLATAVTNRSPVKILIWLAILFAYPFIVLTISGFMSYGTTAVIIVGSLAVVRIRSALQSILIIMALGYIGISGFVNYFESRTELRSTLWSGAGFGERVGAVVNAFSALETFNPDNPRHMRALTIRLNQNEFVGLAAELLLGWVIGWLDQRSATALATSDPSRALLYFLPGIAMIQPGGSLVEVVGGAFAAFLAAVGLRLGWIAFQTRSVRSLELMSRQGRPVMR
ncbi:MAG: hypothetical protein EBY21_13730 [Alphaproteobacteria bacterium]|nr:hypothetical protein [Alphaproteobacteria bacterium]